jgi:hypothetical protein
MVRRSNKTVEAILAASRKNEEKDVVLDRRLLWQQKVLLQPSFVN